MQSYAPPIDDYRFLLNDVLGFDQAMAELGKEVDADLAVAAHPLLHRPLRELLQLPLELRVLRRHERFPQRVVHMARPGDED